MRGSQAGARRDRADRERRSSGLGRAPATGNHAARITIRSISMTRRASDRVAEALRAHFSADRVLHTGPAPASEDFGCFRSRVARPLRLLVRGRHRSRVYAKAKEEGRINDLPVNHSPHFAPVLHPTLETGVGGHGGCGAGMERGPITAFRWTRGYD